MEILAQEMRTCKSYHVPENMQEALSDSNGIRQDHAAECCGCILQDSKCTGTYNHVVVVPLLYIRARQPFCEKCGVCSCSWMGCLLSFSLQLHCGLPVSHTACSNWSIRLYGINLSQGTILWSL